MLRFNPAPGWPAPPPGWLPPANWSPDPSWPQPPPGWTLVIDDGAPDPYGQPPYGQHPFGPGPNTIAPNPGITPAQSRTWRLDAAMEPIRALGNDVWRTRLAVLPIAALVAMLVTEVLVMHAWRPHGTVHDVAFGIASILHYAAAVTVILILGAPVARRCGGWFNAFGWSRPRWKDPLLGLGAALGEYIARIVASIAVVIAIPAVRGVSEGNVSLAGRSTAQIVVLGIVAIVVAPPVEELIFRGLLLRTAMRRMPFWPAALLSSVCFAALHLYEVHSVPAATLLFVSVFVFGLGQCLLVRFTGRLNPGIAAHAVSNAASLLIVLASGR
jgi:membrane protease YdiL (CAAX protease family)